MKRQKSEETKENKNFLLLEFSALSFVAFVIIGYTVVSAVRPALEGFTLKREEGTTVVVLNRSANQLLTARDFKAPLTNEQTNKLEQFIQNASIIGMVQFFIVDNSGTVIYAQPQTYIGTSLAENPYVKLALERRQATARFQKLVPEEQQALGLQDVFVQVVPVTFGTADEVSGVVYTLSRIGLLQKQIADIETTMILRIVAGLLFLYALLFVIVWGASRTIRQQARELASYARTLEQKVVERTKKLEESTAQQLAQAKELARLKDEFVFIAAHELRAPITHLRWAIAEFVSDKIMQSQASQGMRDLVKAIQQASNQLVSLVSDLLNVARLESGTVKVSVHPTDLVSVVQDIVLQFKIEAEKQGIALAFDYDKSRKIPFAMSDSERLKEVFTNFISNAIKYNKPQGRIDVSVYEKEGGFLEASVKDTGLGMSEDDLKNLFSKFWRAPQHKNIEGTGLGLWITKQLIERMGGKIWAESQKDIGSTFFVRLPIASEKSVKDAVPADQKVG